MFSCFFVIYCSYQSFIFVLFFCGLGKNAYFCLLIKVSIAKDKR